jgi:hypothetical protein
MPDVRLGQYSISVKLDHNLLPRFSNKEKASIFAACLQKLKKAIQQVPPGMVLGDDMHRRTEEREEITG